MKALFAYTGDYCIGNDGNPYSQSLNYNMFLRYKKFFDHITIAGRYSKKNQFEYKKINQVEGQGISFVGLVEKKHIFSVFLHKKQINKKLEREIDRVDAVIARVPSEIAYWAIKIANKKGVPVIAEVVGCPFDSLYNHGSILGKLYAPIAKLKLKSTMKNIDYAIYVTGNFLQNRYPNIGRNIACSDVEIENYNLKNLQKRINKIGNKNSGNPIIIGLMGSLDVMYKGHKVALKAVNKLKDMGVNVIIRFAGGGNVGRWMKLAKKLNIKECIEYSGLLSKEEVEKWLQDIDIYIQPSLIEGLPRAVIEAMSFACPVIGSTAGGIPELIDNKYLTNPNDYKGLAEKIYILSTDKQIAIDQAKKNFKKAEDFIFEKLNKKRERFFKMFIDENCFKSR